MNEWRPQQRYAPIFFPSSKKGGKHSDTPEVDLRSVALSHEHLGCDVDGRAARCLKHSVLIADNFRETKVA